MIYLFNNFNKLVCLSIVLLFSSCTFMKYGLTNVPDGCNIQSYRNSQGELVYYVEGDVSKCNDETIRSLYERNGKRSF